MQSSVHTRKESMKIFLVPKKHINTHLFGGTLSNKANRHVETPEAYRRIVRQG